MLPEYFRQLYITGRMIMGGTLIDYILTVAAIVVGIALLLGKGEVFMKGGNTELRKKLYDEKKMEKSSGIALILIGVATGISTLTTNPAVQIGYLVVLVLIFIAWIYYLKVKCKK